jgi:hypothetical protein
MMVKRMMTVGTKINDKRIEEEPREENDGEKDDDGVMHKLG